jgi:hypothetical protein
MLDMERDDIGDNEYDFVVGARRDFLFAKKLG